MKRAAIFLAAVAAVAAVGLFAASAHAGGLHVGFHHGHVHFKVGHHHHHGYYHHHHHRLFHRHHVGYYYPAYRYYYPGYYSYPRYHYSYPRTYIYGGYDCAPSYGSYYAPRAEDYTYRDSYDDYFAGTKAISSGTITTARPAEIRPKIIEWPRDSVTREAAFEARRTALGVEF
jgi:hypothetical protein